MKFTADLKSYDPDIPVMIKMGAAVIEQIEKGDEHRDMIKFTSDEFMRLPWHWELLGGRLAFRCERWAENNKQKHPETDGYPPILEG
jgi:hypothetical protein